MSNQKEKAKELIEKFEPFADYNECDLLTERETMLKNAKQCASITVDEIIKEYGTLPHFGELYGFNIEYWEEVKNEIEKL